MPVGLGALPVAEVGIDTAAGAYGAPLATGAALAPAVTMGAGREACVLPQAKAASAVASPKTQERT